MHDFLTNLLIGIVGGVFSSIIVSRIFLLREELQIQLDVIKNEMYYFGSIFAFIDVIEIILKKTSDYAFTSNAEIKKQEKSTGSAKVVNVNDIIMDMKEQILVRAVDKICNRDDYVFLNNKDFLQLSMETQKIIGKYRDVDSFNFAFVDTSRKEIKELEQKHKECIDKRGKYLFKSIMKDKILIVLGIIFCMLCVALLIV